MPVLFIKVVVSLTPFLLKELFNLITDEITVDIHSFTFLRAVVSLKVDDSVIFVGALKSNFMKMVGVRGGTHVLKAVLFIYLGVEHSVFFRV